MPELPDLEIIREVLAPRLTGQTITDVEGVRPLVIRDLTGQLIAQQDVADADGGRLCRYQSYEPHRGQDYVAGQFLDVTPAAGSKRNGAGNVVNYRYTDNAGLHINTGHQALIHSLQIDWIEAQLKLTAKEFGDALDNHRDFKLLTFGHFRRADYFDRQCRPLCKRTGQRCLRQNQRQQEYQTQQKGHTHPA